MIALARLVLILFGVFAVGTATGLVLIGPAIVEIAEQSGRILLPFLLTSAALLIAAAAYAVRVFIR